MKASKLIGIFACLFFAVPSVACGQNSITRKKEDQGKMRVIREERPDGSVWLVILGGTSPYTFSMEGTAAWFEQIDANGKVTRTKKIVQKSNKIRLYGSPTITFKEK